MAKQKLKRFEEVSGFQNVMELTDFRDEPDSKPAGEWNASVFGNEHPITLELACGKGHYTVELARRYPEKNFIGVDIKGARIWHGAKKALEEELGNVRFLRIFIDHLEEYFGEEEISSIWITFPDPYPKGNDRQKRLTASRFLQMYQRILKPGASVHLKTDDEDLFDFSRWSVDSFGGTILESIGDVYADDETDPMLTIPTDYEKKHRKKGKSIHYLRFTLD